MLEKAECDDKGGLALMERMKCIQFSHQYHHHKYHVFKNLAIKVDRDSSNLDKKKGTGGIRRMLYRLS